MLQSYEAIYAHGAIRGLGEKPSINQAHVIVTILGVKETASAPLQTNKQTTITPYCREREHTDRPDRAGITCR